MSGEEPKADEYSRLNKIDYLGNFPGARLAQDVVAVVIEEGEVSISDNPIRQLGVVSVNELPDDIDVAIDPNDTIGVTQSENFIVTDDGDMAVTIPNTVEVTQTSGGQFIIQENNPLDVSGAEVDVDINSQTLSELVANIAQIGGEAQSAVDVANKIDQIQAATAAAGGDQLRVDLQNNNAGTLPVEQQSAIAVEATDGTGLNPLSQRDLPAGVDTAEGTQDSLQNADEFNLAHTATEVADTNVAFEVVINNPSGSGVEAFLSVAVNGSGLASVDVAENIAIDTAGTALDAIPKRAEAGNSPSITVEQGGAYTVNGDSITYLTSGSIQGGGNSNSSGGDSPVDSGFNVPPGASRLYRVTNASGGESSYSISAGLKEV